MSGKAIRRERTSQPPFQQSLLAEAFAEAAEADAQETRIDLKEPGDVGGAVTFQAEFDQAAIDGVEAAQELLQLFVERNVGNRIEGGVGQAINSRRGRTAGNGGRLAEVWLVPQLPPVARDLAANERQGQRYQRTGIGYLEFVLAHADQQAAVNRLDDVQGIEKGPHLRPEESAGRAANDVLVALNHFGHGTRVAAPGPGQQGIKLVAGFEH